MDRERPRPPPSAEPVADELAVEEERAAGAALVTRPDAFCHERAVRHAYRRQVEDRAEVECEAGSTRMIAAACVDDKDVRRHGERAHGALEQRTLAKGEKPRLVRRASLAGDDDCVAADGGARPGSVPGVSRPSSTASEADEAAADSRLQLEPPQGRVEPREPLLLFDQLLGRARPLHMPILGRVASEGASVNALVEAALAAGVRDERVLEAIGTVPRADFVPSAFGGEAEVDRPIRIPHEQVTTQPSLVARMVEALGLEGRERVLEVGTGYGWQTAVLARLAGDVFSIERFADLAETARVNLARLSIEKANVFVGDGTEGLAEHAPFDAILVSAAFPEVPAPLAQQLAEGGRLVQPIGPGGNDDVLLFEKRGGDLEQVRFVSGARFVRLYGRHGFR